MIRSGPRSTARRRLSAHRRAAAPAAAAAHCSTCVPKTPMSLVAFASAARLAAAACLACFCVVWTAGLFLLNVLAIAYARYKLHRSRPAAPVNGGGDAGSKLTADGAAWPPVSVIKPLLGVDDTLAENLETYFLLDYPEFELLFCAHTPNDAALGVVESLRQKYPHVDVSCFVGGHSVGLNPKINNMMPAYMAAKHDRIVISDAGIKMASDGLRDMVAAMADDVAVVTQLPYVADRARPTFATTLEKVYFGTQHARMYLSADLFGIICSTGMSSLLRKPALDSVGGMQAFGYYLAEDYFFAKKLHKNGWKAALARKPALQNRGVATVASFYDRVCRWTKLRQAMLPHTIVLEPVQDCFVAGALLCWGLNTLLGWNSLIIFLVHALLWMLLDYILLSVVQNSPVPCSKFEFVVSWLCRESSALPVVIRALAEPTIRWRAGPPVKLKWGGVMVERGAQGPPPKPPPALHAKKPSLSEVVTLPARLTLAAVPKR